ncbi:MAG TPA: hypothetical protein VMN57_08245 [Anaerolineales bacterium]|nr:hypothetical protein [Anaerolineales bacterium]
MTDDPNATRISPSNFEEEPRMEFGGEEPKNNRNVIIAVVAAVVFCCCCSAAAAAYWTFTSSNINF